MPSVFFAALDKELVCRVIDKIHSTNIFALGKSAVFGSVDESKSFCEIAWARFYLKNI